MKIDWKSLELHDQDGMKETIEICKKVGISHVKRNEYDMVMLWKRYMKVEGLRIWKGYFIYLILFVLSMLTQGESRSITMLLYNAALGSYFVYQLLYQKENGMQELLYTMSINGVKIFLFQISSFLLVHLSCFLMFSCIVMQSEQMEIISLFEIAVIPLFLALGCSLLLSSRLRSYEGATGFFLLMYTIIMLIMPTSEKKVSMPGLEVMQKMVMHVSDTMKIWMIIFVILLFCYAIYHYEKTLDKEGFYEINC